LLRMAASLIASPNCAIRFANLLFKAFSSIAAPYRR
jgi:hypothetical protein